MNAPFPHPQIGRAASDFLAGRHQLFIGGQWMDARYGKTFETFETFDPGSGRVIARVAEGEAADIDAAVAAARAAFESAASSRMTGSDRAKLMWRLADLIDQNRDELAELESLNNGKPIANVTVQRIKAALSASIYTARSMPPCRSAAISSPAGGAKKGREVLDLYTETKAVVMAL